MTISLYKRHWNIVAHVLISLVAGLGLYLGVVTLNNIVASDDHEQAVAEYEQAERANEFWLEVAGTDPVDGNDAIDQLARRLSTALAGIDDAAEIDQETFSASVAAGPRVYRGITDQLGFDPFVSESCEECGDLTPFMVNSLATLKTAGPEALQVENVPPVDDSDLSLTFLPFLLELIIVWQVAGGVGLFWGLAKYADPRMTWRRGDDQYDAPEYICWAGAPAGMALYMQFWNKKHRKVIETRYQELLQNMRLTDVLEQYDMAIATAEHRLKMSGSNPDLAAELKKLHEDREWLKAQPYEYIDETQDSEIKRLTMRTQQDAETIRSNAEERLRAFQETMDSMPDPS